MIAQRANLWTQWSQAQLEWPAPIVHAQAEATSCIRLIIVGFEKSAPKFLTLKGPWMIGEPVQSSTATTAASQPAVVNKAQTWANQILGQDDIVCELVSDRRVAQTRSYLVMALCQTAQTAKWLSMPQLHPSVADHARQAAVKAASVALGWVHQSVSMLRNGHFGVVPIRLVKARPEWQSTQLDLSEGRWKAMIREDDQNVNKLKTAVKAVDPTGSKRILEWAETAKVCDTTEVPTGVRRALSRFDAEVWKSAVFPRRCSYPPRTEWLPRAKPQPYQKRQVQSLSDFFLPEANVIIEQWVKNAVADLGKPSRHFSQTVVIGPSMCQPWVGAHDGTIWDCRHMQTEGWVETLRFDVPLKTHLNRDLIKKEFAHWPDQEVVSMVDQGVQFKAEVAWQFVLVVHMESFRATAAKVAAEFQLHAQKGWFEQFDSPPFVPMRLMQRGSVPRKNGGRPRSTSNASFPHEGQAPIVDADNQVLQSLNEASIPREVSGRKLEEQRMEYDDALKKFVPCTIMAEGAKFPHELKPTPACLRAMMLVLSSSANFLNEPVFLITDDAANFFNQFALAPEEYWKFVTLLRDEDSGSAKFMAEYCMGFGVRPASNIAQRFANMLVDLVTRRFQKQELQLLQATTEPRLQKWFQHRKTLSEGTGFDEAMLWFMLMYTDDPIIAIVGVDRTVRFLQTGADTIAELGLQMALASKRQLGSGVIWCGALVFARGALVVPLDKRLKALRSLLALRQGTLPVGELRSLNGLLEFCRLILCLDKSTMHGFYQPLQAKGEIATGPQTKVRYNELIAKQANAWGRRLRDQCATSVALAIEGSREVANDASLLITSSDACKEGAEHPGMGGFLTGFWWRYIFKDEHLALDIPVLELVAFAINVIVFKPYVSPLLKPQDVLLCLIDAQASPLVLSDGSSRSAIMMYALGKIRAIPEFQNLEPVLAVAHVFGEGNKPADFASRSNTTALDAYTSQCGLSSIELHPPQRAQTLLDEIVKFQSDL